VSTGEALARVDRTKTAMRGSRDARKRSAVAAHRRSGTAGTGVGEGLAVPGRWLITGGRDPRGNRGGELFCFVFEGDCCRRYRCRSVVATFRGGLARRGRHNRPHKRARKRRTSQRGFVGSVFIRPNLPYPDLLAPTCLTWPTCLYLERSRCLARPGFCARARSHLTRRILAAGRPEATGRSTEISDAIFAAGSFVAIRGPRGVAGPKSTLV